MTATRASPPTPTTTGAQTSSERRTAAVLLVGGLVLASLGMALALRSGLHGGDTRQPGPFLLFLGGLTAYGRGLHLVVWTPRSQHEPVPRAVRVLLTVLSCGLTWFVLATVIGLAGAVLRDSGGGPYPLH